jgi:hypothetical protein
MAATAASMTGATLGRVAESLLLCGIDGFSFILTPGELYVRLAMMDDYDAPVCLENEVWFDSKVKPYIHSTMTATLGPIAPFLEVRGTYTHSITVNSVMVADGKLEDYLAYTKDK